MKSEVEQKLSDYYEKWIGELEELLQHLQAVANGRSELGHQDVVNMLTLHHKAFYTFKWAVAHDDVLAIFAPGWLTPLENARLWITGWKPSMAFRLVEELRAAKPPMGYNFVFMTEDQLKAIEALRVKIKADENKVEREMERHQVAMADQKMVKLVKMERQVKKEGGVATVAEVDGLKKEALKEVLSGLEKLMKKADCMRLKALKGVLESLTPAQAVDFLANKAMLQIQMRKWGKKRAVFFLRDQN